MGELISIVIPTKDRGDVLEQCLGSIGEMDYLEDEMVAGGER